MEKDIILNEISPLRTIGYHTGLSKVDRWDVLEKSCIPELGANKVIFYLEGFVNRFSKNRTKYYSNAVGIWQEDIKRISQKYGKW